MDVQCGSESSGVPPSVEAMDIILVAGLWLDDSAWAAVNPGLRAAGHRPVPISLPGQGAPPAAATLEDQKAAVVAAVDRAAGPALVVGHSAASTLAWLAADARPEKVARVAMIGGFPVADGQGYAGSFEVVDGFVPFPGWDAFEGADVADIEPSQRKLIEMTAIPVPGPIIQGIVRLSDTRRYDVPVTLICPEFSPTQAKEWVAGGELPELAATRHVDYVDIDSGHWPMFTQPDRLARLIANLADG